MNQIVSTVVKLQIFGNVFIHIPITFRYLFDQTPEMFCQIDFFFRHCQTLQVQLYGIAFVIVRYIYVFHAKNITAIQDDFWIWFLNIWILGFSAIAYLVVCQITDKRPRPFFFCLGKISKKSQSDGPFVNYMFDVVFIIGMIICSFVGMKFKIRDYRQFKAKKACVAGQGGFYFKEQQKSNLFTFSGVLVTVIFIVVFIFIPEYQIKNSDWDSLSTFPGYLWIYMYHMYQPNLSNILTIPFIFGKNIHLRNFAIRVTKEILRMRDPNSITTC